MTGRLSAAVRPLLQFAAKQAGLDGCLLVRRQDDRWLVLETSDVTGPVPVGVDVAWADTLCAVVAGGQAPPLVPDVRRVPLLQERAAVLGLELSAYVSLPLQDDDGNALGTLCGWSRQPLRDLAQHASLLTVLADACGQLLLSDLALTAGQASHALDAPDADLGAHTGLLSNAAWTRQLREHDDRCRSLGATASLVLAEVRADVDVPEVLLALLDGLGDGDSMARLPSGTLVLLLVDVGADEARRRAAVLGTALARAGVAHRCCTATSTPRHGLSLALPRAELALRRAVWTPGSGTAVLSDASRVQSLLEAARRQLGQDVAFLSELVDGEQVFHHVVAPPDFPLQAGYRKPASTSLCRLILDGDLPALMGDVEQHPAARTVPEVQAGVIGTYLAAPVRLSDGRVYGTVCCLSAHPTPGLSRRDAVVLQVVADALGRQVEAQIEATSGRRLAHDSLASLLALGGPQAVFQPVVDTGTLEVVGVEALARFPDGRSPLSWFLEAARYGTGVQLEIAACRNALVALPELAAGGRFLAVNLSPAALADDAFAVLLAQVRADGLLDSLVLEITEHEPVHDYDALNALLAPWRAAGVRLAVDDTGAGHSSLRHVLLLEPDVIKLDRELVTAVHDDVTRGHLIASLVAFADRSGRSLVAEGVETDAELACLTDLGVHLVQGFHLARPRAELVLELSPDVLAHPETAHPETLHPGSRVSGPVPLPRAPRPAVLPVAAG